MKKIVIVGGGFAGAYCAKKLEKDFDVILIDTKDYFEFTPSVLRTIVKPAHIRKIQVLHSRYLHRAKLVREEVNLITKENVKTKSKTIFYDYLIIASGSTYHCPIKEKNIIIATRANELRNYADKLRAAEKVLIIGGGLVGVELAAEIVTAYPLKKVTIVHSKEELIERNPAKARAYAQRFLEKHGVQFVFRERVIKHRAEIYFTDRGRKLSSDLAFLCTGIIPNYKYLEGYCSTSLNERHNLCVNSHLQVQSYSHVFAAGDITSIAEEKTAQNAEKQAEIVVKNIYHEENGELLEEYISGFGAIVISLGKLNGILIYKNKVWKGIIPGILKSMIEWKTMRRYRS